MSIESDMIAEAVDTTGDGKVDREIGKLAKFFTPKRMMIVFTLINILNYLDRGIVPGAFEQIGDFIREEQHVNSTDVSLGILQSAFIGGYAVASVTFGHLIHSFPPFKLMAFGLFVWCGAVTMSGLAPKFWFLVIARILSGIGEASFQCVVPPFIDDAAPKRSRALWLSVFYCAIPVGTAMGYGYGSVVASAVSWRAAFMLEAPMMFPLALLCCFLPYHKSKAEASREKAAAARQASRRVSSINREITPAEEDYFYDPREGGDKHKRGIYPDEEEEADHRPGLWQELKIIMASPVYVCVIFGYAAFTFSVSGLGSFGPTILKGLHLFDKETTASVSFGAMVALTGFFGTTIGGLWLDNRQRKLTLQQRQRQTGGASGSRPLLADDNASHTEDGEASEDDEAHDAMLMDPVAVQRESDDKLYISLLQCAIQIGIGTGVSLVAPFVAENLAPFFVSLGTGCLFLFMTTSGVNLAIMASVPPENRPFAIGFSTVINHAFGDVPSPTIIGKVADDLSPTDANGDRSAKGLETTMFLTLLWLSWCAILYAMAWCFAVRQRNRNRKHLYPHLLGREAS